MTALTWWQGPDGRIEIEYKAEAGAGMSLTTGAKWWGTRISYRRRGERRWTHVIAIDVHPFDYETIVAAVRAALAEAAGAALPIE